MLKFINSGKSAAEISKLAKKNKLKISVRPHQRVISKEPEKKEAPVELHQSRVLG